MQVIKFRDIKNYINEAFAKSFFSRNLTLKALENGYSKEKLLNAKKIATISGLVLGLLLVWFSGYSFLGMTSILMITAGVLTGFSLIDAYLYDKDLQRRFKIYAAIPFFIDLMALYTESKAYTSFNEMIKELSNNIDGELGEKLKVYSKSSYLLSSSKILDDLQTDFNDKFIADLATTLSLSFEYGGAISSKIESIAESAYSDRELKFKEAALTGSGKLLIPLMLFHLPVVLALFLIPAIISFNSFF